jgi:hypothetical protein
VEFAVGDQTAVVHGEVFAPDEALDEVGCLDPAVGQLADRERITVDERWSGLRGRSLLLTAGVSQCAENGPESGWLSRLDERTTRTGSRHASISRDELKWRHTLLTNGILLAPF